MPRADVNEGQHEDGSYCLQHYRPPARGRFQQLPEAQALILVLLMPKERASYAFVCFIHEDDFSMPCGLSSSSWLLIIRIHKKGLVNCLRHIIISLHAVVPSSSPRLKILSSSLPTPPLS